MVEFTSRVLDVMEKNYHYMIELAPPGIRMEIDKGSFYQDMLNKMILYFWCFKIVFLSCAIYGIRTCDLYDVNVAL